MKYLHDAILNLPCKHVQTNDPCVELTYQMGHRDARHAAAELVIAVPAVNPWKEAIMQGLCDAAIDAPTDMAPLDILNRIIDMRVVIATDPSINAAPQEQPAADLTDDAFDALCREHSIYGTAEARLCRVFWLAAQKGKS